MTIGKPVIDGIIRHFLPLTILVFAISVRNLIKSGFADVMQQRTNCHALRIVLAFYKVLFHKDLIDVQAVFHQTALVSCVKTRRCRRCKKVRANQPFQQAVCTAALDVLCILIDKNLFIIQTHMTTSNPAAVRAFRTCSSGIFCPYSTICPLSSTTSVFCTSGMRSIRRRTSRAQQPALMPLTVSSI